jgi:type IV pilus assembly protein PilM
VAGDRWEGWDVAGRTSIGLDIGTSGVRAAELSLGKGAVTLEKFGQVALPPGAVHDGEVHDVVAVAAAIKQLWSHTRLSGRKVVVGVANQKVLVRQVDIPWVPADELKKSLAFQVQDFVPMPVEHAVLDFHPLEEVTGENGSRILRGLLVVAAREMVNNALAAVQKAGLTPTMVDLTSFAVLRAMGSPDVLGLGAPIEALVDVGAKVTNIVVHQGGVPAFVRILLMGGEDITHAVSERMGIPSAQAEAIKQEVGLTGNPGLLAPDLQAAARIVESSVAAFVDEVRGSIDYYVATAGAGTISRVLLTGGGARLSGLADRLSGAMSVPVVAGSPLAGLRGGKTGLSPDQLAFVEPLAAVPVGLALGAAA